MEIVIATVRMSATYWPGIGVVVGIATSNSLESCEVSLGGVHRISIEET